jgi:hypothetical protein
VGLGRDDYRELLSRRGCDAYADLIANVRREVDSEVECEILRQHPLRAVPVLWIVAMVAAQLQSRMLRRGRMLRDARMVIPVVVLTGRLRRRRTDRNRWVVPPPTLTVPSAISPVVDIEEDSIPLVDQLVGDLVAAANAPSRSTVALIAA